MIKKQNCHGTHIELPERPRKKGGCVTTYKYIHNKAIYRKKVLSPLTRVSNSIIPAHKAERIFIPYA